MHDPQSLHKYSYVHGDPIQGVDATGMFNAVSVSVSIGAPFSMTAERLAATGLAARGLYATGEAVALGLIVYKTVIPVALSAITPMTTPPMKVTSISLGSTVFQSRMTHVFWSSADMLNAIRYVRAW